MLKSSCGVQIAFPTTVLVLGFSSLSSAVYFERGFKRTPHTTGTPQRAVVSPERYDCDEKIDLEARNPE